MAQPTARHEGDQGGEEWTAVSQTPCQAAASAQPRSMPARSAHPVCRPPKDAERRWQGCQNPFPLRKLSGFRKSRFRCPPPPPPHLLIISRLLQAEWQSRTPEPTVYPTKNLWLLWQIRRAAKSSAVLLCVPWQREGERSQGWHAGSAAGGFRHTHHHTQVPSQHGKEVELWVSFTDRCPFAS